MVLYREIIQGLLKFLSDICDGFNYNAQNYLRAQPNLNISTNIVKEICSTADVLIDDVKFKLLHFH